VSFLLALLVQMQFIQLPLDCYQGSHTQLLTSADVPNNLALTKITAGRDCPTFLGSQAEVSTAKIRFSIPSDDGFLFFYQQRDILFRHKVQST